MKFLLFLALVIEEIKTFVLMVIKFPLRVACWKKHDHDWVWHGGGFFFDCRYSFTCERCGCRSNGDIDDLNKKGFKGTASID